MCVWICMYTCIYIYIYIYADIYIYTYVDYINMCVYVYMFMSRRQKQLFTLGARISVIAFGGAIAVQCFVQINTK